MGWIKSGEREISSQELQNRARKAAGVIASYGLTAGDGIALYMRNDIPYFEASFGASLLGVYPVPVNWHYTPDEAAYLFEDSGAKLLIIHADLYPGIKDAIPADLATIIVEPSAEIIRDYGLAATPPPHDLPVWSDLLERAPPFDGPPREVPVAVIYTSGTTGRPKGVVLSDLDSDQVAALNFMFGWAYGFSEALEGKRNPATLTTAVIGPVYHSAPSAHATCALRLGINVVIEPKFDAERLLQMIERERITHLNLVPIMFNRLLRLPDEIKRRYDLSSLEYVAHAAAPCPAPVKRAMIDWWGPIIWEYYGSTEMGNVTHLSSEEWLSHPGSVGRVMPLATLRVIDEHGKDMPVGEIGEVAGKGGHGSGFTYKNAPQKRAEMEKFGLITPGDVGYFDEDGFLYLCDRKNDMIISGGANIYPAEIEAVLHKMPDVADCAVFGIPDEEFGESVMAVVQLMPGAEMEAEVLRARLREVLAGYKVPRRIEFLAELPREDSGKIFKRKLRAPFWEGRERQI